LRPLQLWNSRIDANSSDGFLRLNRHEPKITATSRPRKKTENCPPPVNRMGIKNIIYYVDVDICLNLNDVNWPLLNSIVLRSVNLNGPLLLVLLNRSFALPLYMSWKSRRGRSRFDSVSNIPPGYLHRLRQLFRLAVERRRNGGRRR